MYEYNILKYKNCVFSGVKDLKSFFTKDVCIYLQGNNFLKIITEELVEFLFLGLLRKDPDQVTEDDMTPEARVFIEKYGESFIKKLANFQECKEMMSLFNDLSTLQNNFFSSDLVERSSEINKLDVTMICGQESILKTKLSEFGYKQYNDEL